LRDGSGRLDFGLAMAVEMGGDRIARFTENVDTRPMSM
jgi:hypothetical protein